MDTSTTAEPSAYPFAAFQEHCQTGTSNNTELVILGAIRAAHPNLDVVPFSASEFDVLRWAKHSQVELTILRQNNHFYARRKFEVPETRLAGDGELIERVMFGYYRLVFKDRIFHFYAAEWPLALDRQFTKSFFLLSERSNIGKDGYATSTDELLETVGKWTPQLHEEVYIFDGFDWMKDSKLWKAVQESHWDNVILEPSIKQALIDDIHGFFDSEATFHEFAVPWKRGIIFHGIPGCGKTMSIKALMKSLDERQNPVVSLLVKTFEGCSTPQDAVRESFSMARQMAPCLLIFEDLDSLITDEVRSNFLNEVDGLESNHGILIIATTNHLERLDPGISKRPSRFDRKYHFKAPNEHERLLYFEHWRKKFGKNERIDFSHDISEILAKITEEFSFAYLQELLVQTMLSLARGGFSDLALDDSEEAVREVNATDYEDGDTELGDYDASKGQPDLANDQQQHQPLHISVPEHLQANKLFCALCNQVDVLKRDMAQNVQSDLEKPTDEPIDIKSVA